MANASYIQDSFAGGEKSQLAQGRITDREYRTWLNVCVNGHPTEAGGWVRRSGTMFAGHTRGGAVGRVIKWDFAAATADTIEFTNGFIRFRQGLRLITTNDVHTVLGISSANPAVVQIDVSGWATGTTVIFAGDLSRVPLLANRQFTITVVGPTRFSLQDAMTGANIDGSTFTLLPGGALTALRIHELVSPYVGNSWASLRAVQAETTAVLLQAAIPPQLLSVTTPPSSGVDAQFSIAGLTFLDGPYLDPFTNGVQVIPGALSGNVTLTLAFPSWISTQAYKIGDFVNSAAINYVSLIDNNVNLTPAGNPSAWQFTSVGAAINNGQGFLGTDVGRLIRLRSEPAIWNSATAYVAGNLVSYAGTYWTSLTSNTNKIPGTDVTNWALSPQFSIPVTVAGYYAPSAPLNPSSTTPIQTVAVWTWCKITGLANQIAQNLAGSVNIGNMTQGGGIAAAFDNVTSQSANQSAEITSTTSSNVGIGGGSGTFSLANDGYVGKNYTGAAAQKIQNATIFPSTDDGFNTAITSSAPFSGGITVFSNLTQNVTLNLRANASAPASPSDGTLLGSVTNPPATQAVTIVSNDQVTAWNYVWIELVGSGSVNWSAVNSISTLILVTAAAEVQFFNPPGTGGGNAINVEILGPPLLYTSAINTWRLGAYSNTTAWPTCGTYHEGRIWLGGAIGNRFDASVSNGLVGTTLNFAPTDQNGVVGAANAITGTVNSDGVNPIFWFTPDLQGIIMGTQAGEWLISATSAGAMSAINIGAHRVTRIGCANVEPRKTDHTNVFVQRYTRKVMEYFTDVYSGKFASPNLAKDTLHITKPGVAELAYTQAVVPVIWGRNSDGSWFGATYKRDTLATSTGPTINGWHRHNLGSGRTVQSICSGPSVGGNLDALTMVTLDSGTGIYHVEVMTDTVDEGNTLIQATYLDDAVNPTSTTTSNVTPVPYGGLTLNGLWHLNGKTVTAWLGGLDCGDYTVTNGSIIVPYGDGISAGTANGLFTSVFAAGLSLSQMLVGFTFTSQGQLVRPATPQESGARNGPAVGKIRRNHKIAAQLEGAGVGVSFGTTFAKVDPAKFRQPNDTALAVNQQFTGIYKDTLTDTYSFDGMVCWQLKRPYPFNIANIGGFIETVDE